MRPAPIAPIASVAQPPRAASPVTTKPVPPASASRPDPGALELEPLALISVLPPAAPSPSDGDDIDSAFARLASGAPQPGIKGSLAEDPAVKAANGQLFRQMAVGHARPVREFMLELVVGPTTKQWLAIAKPAVDSLSKGANTLDQHELESALSKFRAALDRASAAPGPKIAGAERDALLAEYGRLASELPNAFDLKSDRARREPLVVHHLLLQIPGVHKVAIDKLYSAGLASLDALCRSSAADLMGLGHLDADTANAIFRRFQAYWQDRTAEPLQKAQEQAKRKLGALLEKLGHAHEDFQRAEADEDRERKRLARGERRARCLEVNVLLAQLGEVDLVEDLERSPTEIKIARVRDYIERASGTGMLALEEAV